MPKDMSARNRPKSNTESGLTPNGRGPAGERPGSAPEGNTQRPPGVSGAGIRRFFAPGTPASAAADPGGPGGLPADIDELAATLGRPHRTAGGAAVEVAAAAPATGVEPEASSRLGTVAARLRPRRVGRWVDVPADVARANPSTPAPAGTAATWR